MERDICDYCLRPTKHLIVDDNKLNACADCHSAFTKEEDDYTQDIFDNAMLRTFMKDQR